MKTSMLLLISLTFAASCSREVKKTSGSEAFTQKLQEMQSTAAAIYQQESSADQSSHNHFLVIMDESQDLGSKMIAAAKYYKSMEFQLWGGTKTPSNIKPIHQMYDDAALDITGRLFDLYKEFKIKEISPRQTGRKHNEEVSFYALAATMDEKTGKFSFMDLAKKALLSDLNGKTLLTHEETLLSGSNKEMITELIKARVDILASIALNDLTDYREVTPGQKTKKLLVKMFTLGRKGSVKLPETYNKANEATKNKILKDLETAVSAKNFLKELGIDKDLQKYLREAFSNIDFDDKPQTTNQAGTVVKDEKKESIRIAIGNLLE